MRFKASTSSGSAFTVNFKVNCIDAGSYHSEESNSAEEKPFRWKIKNFVCEDNDLNAEITKAVLESGKMIADIAENGLVGKQRFEFSEETTMTPFLWIFVCR